MNAKEYLRQALYLKQDIENKQNQIIEVQTVAQRATGSYEALRISGTPSHSKVEDAVVKLESLGNELADLATRFREKYREISAVIDAVENPTYRRLLSLRYLSFVGGKLMPWEQIAVEMGYSLESVSWIHKLHGRALQKLDMERHTPSVL